ncbi:MAG: uroporphyrinogen decarboxylase, partial [Chloroflexi bacterium]|nr:uroporphyrinogen decarboxylase [Chloroflexota bacterium]
MTTHRERMEACLAGKIIDRPPVALWRHFPVDDQNPEKLAAATLQWQKTYDWDLVKVTPASSFALKDWGVEDQWRGDSEGTRSYTKRVISSVEDWSQLTILDADSPHLAAQLKSLSILRAALGPDVPLIQTVFSPLAQAKNLAGGEKLLAHIRMRPEWVGRGLEIILESTRRFIRAARAMGLIDGIFYAVQHAQGHLLTKDEFVEFGRSYDLQVLESARMLWLNILHAHGENIYFNNVADYPVHVINWHDRDTAPTLNDALSRTRSVLCGGLRRETMVFGSAEDVDAEAADAFQQTNGRRLLLGTGCVVPIIAPHGNLLSARKSV